MESIFPIPSKLFFLFDWCSIRVWSIAFKSGKASVFGAAYVSEDRGKDWELEKPKLGKSISAVLSYG